MIDPVKRPSRAGFGSSFPFAQIQNCKSCTKYFINIRGSFVLNGPSWFLALKMGDQTFEFLQPFFAKIHGYTVTSISLSRPVVSVGHGTHFAVFINNRLNARFLGAASSFVENFFAPVEKEIGGCV